MACGISPRVEPCKGWRLGKARRKALLHAKEGGKRPWGNRAANCAPAWEAKGFETKTYGNAQKWRGKHLREKCPAVADVCAKKKKAWLCNLQLLLLQCPLFLRYERVKMEENPIVVCSVKSRGGKEKDVGIPLPLVEADCPWEIFAG